MRPRDPRIPRSYRLQTVPCPRYRAGARLINSTRHCACARACAPPAADPLRNAVSLAAKFAVSGIRSYRKASKSDRIAFLHTTRLPYALCPFSPHPWLRFEPFRQPFPRFRRAHTLIETERKVSAVSEVRNCRNRSYGTLVLLPRTFMSNQRRGIRQSTSVSI